MNVSDVLATTMASLRGRGLGLVGIWLGFVVLGIVFVIAAMATVGGSMIAAMGAGAAMVGNVDQIAGGLGLGMIGMVAVFYLLYLMIYMAQGLAMAHYASPLVDGDLGASFGTGFRGAPTMLGVMILFLIAYFIAAMILAVLGALFAMVGKAAVILYALIVAPAAIYLMCRLCIIMPVVAVDGIRNPVTAIARTWKLTNGNALAIFLSLLAYIVAAIVIFGGMVAAFATTIEGYQESMMMGAAEGLGSLIGFFIALAVAGLVFAAAGAALISAIHSKLSDMGATKLSETFG